MKSTRIGHVLASAAAICLGCAHDVRVVRGEATTSVGNNAMAVSSIRFEDVYLRARVLLSSTKGALRLHEPSTYCHQLFHLVGLTTCGGEDLGVVHGDCVGFSEGATAPITLEQDVWVGQDDTWYIGEEAPECVEVHLQAYFDGTGSRRPGPRLSFRAYRNGQVELISPQGK